ncbi:RagB/SusD family nutrient uptake outer membrane protein [Pedobacter sp. ASV28]|uniref:RagB/SusD family nutrient uptake outer membrane protein n=1 Tax=Pedobacter sp. ASV28 TaxID=2795123 RepID=UPI0018EB69BF|nr:RagB/SusD family nutrient uptake outer membrane protein [Pedobacter sp. ASV28]
MRHNKEILIIAFLFISFLNSSCRKEFLEESPDKSLLVPKTLDDFQALLDNNQVMNISPALSFISADDFTITESGYNGLVTPMERNGYIWAPMEDLYEGRAINDWSVPYLQVFYCNVVLEGLQKVKLDAGNEKRWKEIKGTALFNRSFAFYNLAQLFAQPYSNARAKNTLGIPIRLSSDVNIKSTRGNLFDAYQQILADLTEAVKLLPINVSYKTRPKVASANLLLAKAYLMMGDYPNAQLYAQECIKNANGLINYNSLSTTSTRPFPIALPNSNDEVLYYSSMITYGYLSSAQTGVDLNLYQSYSQNDLRKALYYRDRGNSIYQFKGNYTGSASQFGGLSTNEAYLIKSECEARNGDFQSAMNTLNDLLKNRWKTGSFVALTAPNKEEALKIIMLERRKELVARDTRWSDLRRYNLESNLAKDLTRTIGSKAYLLPAGDLRYTLPIPVQEIQLGGIEQNPRN